MSKHRVAQPNRAPAARPIAAAPVLPPIARPVAPVVASKQPPVAFASHGHFVSHHYNEAGELIAAPKVAR